MKRIKMILAVMVLGAVIASLAGCSSKDDAGTVKTQTVDVKRGNLTLDITAAGNLALAHTEDLAVDLFYPTGTKGTIGEVLVEAGDSVKEGDVLVTLDKSEWDDQLATLESLVTTKERALVQAQISLKTAEQTLKNSQNTVSTREVAVLSAQITYDQALTSLSTSISAIDYQSALAEYRKAQAWYDYVTTTYKSTAPSTDDYTLTLQNAQDRLTVARTSYDNVLTGYNSQEVNLKKQQLEVAERNLTAARGAVEDSKIDVTLKELGLTLSQGNLQDAEKALEDAKKNVAEAKSKSPEIKAPFDGFITTVNVAGGDEVLNGTVVAQVADPDKFEADILVSEMDIPKVKVGSVATVTADALSGTILPAKVTNIAPTATISSGVVNYAVKVQIEALPDVSQSRAALQPSAGNVTSGTLPPMLQKAVDEGRMTREQAEEFVKNGPPADFKPPEGFTQPSGFTPSEGAVFGQGFASFDMSGSKATGQLPATTLSADEVQLRQGLTVTVSIIVDNRTNVLLVPNTAVTKAMGESSVQVVTASGTAEKRVVKTGLSDWQYTEITEGLNEGEKVSVPENLGTSSSSANRGGMFFGGGPR
jgi:multidrug efflux pump subunit AcrA (membrane-fusion protein)